MVTKNVFKISQYNIEIIKTERTVTACIPEILQGYYWPPAF